MRSFALWYSFEKPSDEQKKEISVHINLWDKKEADNKSYYFDFGFLVEDIKGINKLNLYVPFEVNKNQITDLGRIISKNKLVNAIFNENFKTTEGEPKRLIVNGNEEKSDFVIYSLDIESQINVTRCIRPAPTPGTILAIDIKNIVPKDIYKYYFRIRIKVSNRDIYLINDEIKGVSIFSDQFTNTEVIDFRLNDIRSCSEELREQFDKGKEFNIKAIHYLILRNANDIIIHYGKEINSRILEKDLWKEYIHGIDQNIIAYHVKSKAKKTYNKEGEVEIEYIDSFSDLTRFQYQKTNWPIIIMYVIGIIGFGAVGGVLGNWLYELIGLTSQN